MSDEAWANKTMLLIFESDAVVHSFVTEWVNRVGSSIKAALNKPDVSEVRELFETVESKTTKMNELIQFHRSEVQRFSPDDIESFTIKKDLVESLSQSAKEVLRLLQKMYPIPEESLNPFLQWRNVPLKERTREHLRLQIATGTSEEVQEAMDELVRRGGLEA